jgi:hypothetical protein
MRVAPHPRVLSRPWPTAGACAFIEALLASPGIAIPAETDRHATVLREIVADVADVTGNVVGVLHIDATKTFADARERVRSSVGIGSCRSANVPFRQITKVWSERRVETFADARERVPTVDG